MSNFGQMSNFGEITYPEIIAQPEALKAAYHGVFAQKDWVEQYLVGSQYDEVIFIGSGSSYYQALSMASTYRRWLGRSAAAYPSSEIYLFREHNSIPGRSYLLIAVSRSGESSEVILALESVKTLTNWSTCGITCHEDSKMAQITRCLVSPLGKEKSTVMTKSFSSMVFMMQAAIAAAAENQEMMNQLKAAQEIDRVVVEKADAFIKEFVANHEFTKYIFLGMGAYYGLSQEACLKLKEMSYVWTESYGTLEFRHGPKSIVEPGALVCLLVSEQARAYELKVAEEMKAYGAHVLLITTERGQDTRFADAVFEVGGREITDEARSVLYMPSLQFIGFYTALKNKVNPDFPRNLTQVVKI